MMIAAIGGLVAATAIPGLLRPFTPIEGAVTAAALAALAAGAIWCGRHAIRRSALHVFLLAATGVLVAANHAAGPSATALLDLFVVLALYAYFYFGAAQASIHMFVNAAAYSSIALAQNVDYASLRVAITATVLLTTSGLVARMRSVAVRFARINHELAELDPLTGLANIRSLRARIAHAIAAARAGGPPPVLIAVDLDNFKSVNDRHSHTTGDQVLEAVSKAISESLRPDDLAARRGGDEFFVLCEGVEDHEAAAMAARIREAIAYARHRICPDMTSAASVAAVAWSPGVDIDSFIHDADLALHASKLRARAESDPESAAA